MQRSSSPSELGGGFLLPGTAAVSGAGAGAGGRRREPARLVGFQDGLALAELALTIDKGISGRLGLDVVLFHALGPHRQRNSSFERGCRV